MVAGEKEARISRLKQYSKGVWMMEGLGTSRAAPDEYVEFWATGQSVKGEFHCSGVRLWGHDRPCAPDLPHVRRPLLGAICLEPSEPSRRDPLEG